MKSLTATAISIDDKGFPTLSFDVLWDGLQLTGGKDDGCKNKASDSLVDAMNAFMPLVIQIGSLGEDWEAEQGAESNIVSIKFGKNSLSLSAKLTKDKIIGQGTESVPFSVSVPYADLGASHQLMISKLRQEITNYREGLSEQGDLFEVKEEVKAS